MYLPRPTVLPATNMFNNARASLNKGMHNQCSLVGKDFLLSREGIPYADPHNQTKNRFLFIYLYYFFLIYSFLRLKCSICSCQLDLDMSPSNGTSVELTMGRSRFLGLWLRALVPDPMGSVWGPLALGPTPAVGGERLHGQ